MEGDGRSAACGGAMGGEERCVSGAMSAGGQRGWMGRRVVLAALLSVAVLLCAVSAAQAVSNFYWYGENGSNCLQTGQFGEPSFECEGGGPNYLQAPGANEGGREHLYYGGVQVAVDIPKRGDYCDYWDTGASGFFVNKPSATNLKSWTGLETVQPFESYQETDGSGANCQSEYQYWGQTIAGKAKGDCGSCGMFHYVSFDKQEAYDRPWANSFGNPSLVISSSVEPGSVSGLEGVEPTFWGYTCPVLEDTTTGFMLEYCLQEWRGPYNVEREENLPPAEKEKENDWEKEGIKPGYCSSGISGTEHGGALDMLKTKYDPGTVYATEYTGSQNTFIFAHNEKSAYRHMAASISTGDLESAIAEDNAVCASHRGGQKMSTELSAYALLGVEQGIEGWDHLGTLGANAAALEVWTQYNQLPPNVTTDAASERTPTTAKLNGEVKPNGLETHYDFEYGTESGHYTKSVPVPEGNAGTGGSAVVVNANITGLSQGTTYHYRVVASNSAGTIDGKDETFVTTKASFNGDGMADLAVCEKGKAEYAVAVSNGKELNAPGSGVWKTGWGCNSKALVGDFTGNSLDDVVIPNVSNNTWGVMLSNGKEFGAAGTGTWLTGLGAAPAWAGVGDFTGNGKDDLVTCENNVYAVAVSNGKEFGASGTGVWKTGWGCNPKAIVGDFTGNGLDDIAIPNESNNTWGVMLSNGKEFGAPGTGTWLTGWTTTPEWAATGDFTGNGMDDLVVCNHNEYAVALSNGKELNAPGSGVWKTGWGCNKHAIVGDFNGDGKDDILIPNESNNTWGAMLSNGKEFGAPGTGTWLTGWTTTPEWAGTGSR
jgi:hypothetical protein